MSNSVMNECYECGAMTNMLSGRSRCARCEHRRAIFNAQENERLREQIGGLAQREAELAAHVDGLKRFLAEHRHNMGCYAWLDRFRDMIKQSPATSLADRDKRGF